MEKQHFEILLESMDSKFDIMMEGFSSLSKKINDNHAELKGDISLLDEKISALSNRIGSVETNLNAKIDSVEAGLEARLGARIDSVETNLSNRMDGIDGRLDDIHSELIDHRNNSEMHNASRKREIKKAA